MGTFSDERRPTAGADFFIKKMEIDDVDVDLQVWDTAGFQLLFSIFNHNPSWKIFGFFV